MIKDKALQVIRNACIPKGILATAEKKDNYQSVWARDACMSGIVGILYQDSTITDAFRSSLITLATHQHALGMIPSNVGSHGKVSYGSLVGRVDASIWFVLGVGVYLSNSKSEKEKTYFLPFVEKALHILEAWEFNGRDLVYIPMSGNWADEYVTQGYTLYDNCLRAWALWAVGEVWNHKSWKEKSLRIQKKIATHYQYQHHQKVQHDTAYSAIQHMPYWACSFGAFGYDTRWDMAGNAFATLLGLSDHKTTSLANYLDRQAKKNRSYLLSTFFPLIKKNDADWKYLKENYSFQFKNKVHHFQNGGAWPIFLGWLGAALYLREKHTQAQHIQTELYTAIEKDKFLFREYIATDTQKFGGTKQLCYTATGVLLLDYFNHRSLKEIKKTLILPS